MLRSAVEDLIIMCQRRLNDSVIILSDLFAAFKALLEILLSRGFEYLLAVLLPLLETAKADAQLVRILSLRQPQFRSDCLDLLTLAVSQKEIVVIQKSFDWNLEKLRDFLHVLRRIEAFSIFFIVDIGTPVYPGVVCNISLTQTFLVT